jgi:hypothetical protein
MTTLTAPAPQVNSLQTNEEPIPLFKLGALFVIRSSYWSCRIGNEPEDFNLSDAEMQERGIASLGTRELIDPAKSRKQFQHLEKKARHALARYSRVFPAAGAHFVPWPRVSELVEQLQAIKTEFDQAVEHFLADYPKLRAEWQSQHTEIPDACYPLPTVLGDKFNLTWHAFKVSGAAAMSGVDDIETELERRRVRQEQVKLMEANLQSECRRFVEQYVRSFRQEVVEFCDQVISVKGQVHGKTLTAIRDRIDKFHAMNVFGDADAASKLTQLKQQIAGLTGQDLAQQPAVAEKLSRACQAIKNHVLDPANVSALTGRLKRRVVLD